jgi:NAD(P)-dependent dehydrogenase (short-subunit alcohol dehydrogenase family)
VRVEVMQADITQEGMPKKIIDQCVNTFGSLDILVNNAGICKLNPILKFDRKDWDPMIDVNLTAAFEMSYEAAKIMIPNQKGKIINICSLFSYLGGQGSPAYSATKHALAGFTKAYCDELGQFNIQVNGIAPGYYATQITEGTRKDPVASQRVLDHIPANRWGDPLDLMGAVIFLASRASDYVNGHLLVVDGGYRVR